MRTQGGDGHLRVAERGPRGDWPAGTWTSDRQPPELRGDVPCESSLHCSPGSQRCLLCTDLSQGMLSPHFAEKTKAQESTSLGVKDLNPKSSPPLWKATLPTPVTCGRTQLYQAPRALTCRLSLLQTPLTVLVGAMVTTGGVLGTLWPPGGTMMGPMGTRLGVLAGELWLVAGEDTGDDSLLSEDPAREGHRASAVDSDSSAFDSSSPAPLQADSGPGLA